jgi:HKD family nuclease
MHHLISEAETFGRRLIARLEACSQGFIATAFFTNGAMSALRDGIEQAIRRRAKLTFLVGQYDYITDPKAVDGLLRLAKTPGAKLRVLFDHDFEFHYKVALFKAQGSPVAIIGSSNVTMKGLSSRGEDNIEIIGETSLQARLVSELERRAQIALKAEEHLEYYASMHDKYRRLRLSLDRANAAGNRKLSKIRRKAPVLPLKPESLTTLTYCNIAGYENDPKIKSGTKAIVKEAKKEGLSFPSKWVRVPRGERQLYKADERFLIADDDHRIIGLALCVRNAEVLDSDSRRVSVVFYRFERGWKFRFPGDATYIRKRAQLRAGSKVRLGMAAVRNVNRVLQGFARRNRNRRASDS